VSQAAFSPNARWLVYVSDESGREEVYVRPFPSAGSRWPISVDGGREPVWARSGGEVFYRNGNRMMAVTVTSDATFTATKPALLFEGKALSGIGSYDVTPEGEFLMIEPGESDSPASQLNVVLNWLQEVRQRMATRQPLERRDSRGGAGPWLLSRKDDAHSFSILRSPALAPRY
jgi:serine/threonine-protein kinase